MSLWPSKKQWKYWSLPSKLTAIGTLVGLLSLGLYGLEKGFHITKRLRQAPLRERQYSVPDILVKVSNSGDTEVSIVPRGEFVLWLPQGVDDTPPRIPGKYKLHPIGENTNQNDLVRIRPGTEVPMYLRMMNQDFFGRMLERGDADLSVIFRRNDGSIFFSRDMPFTKSDISKYFLPADASRK